LKSDDRTCLNKIPRLVLYRAPVAVIARRVQPHKNVEITIKLDRKEIAHPVAAATCGSAQVSAYNP
jgi:hypothetical protein